MFQEFGPAPLCLELDLDSYEGAWQHVWRFRERSGWLLVAKATVQSADDLITRKLVVACDEHEEPIPSFQALHLTQCNWKRPTECMELPPPILDDLLCEEEGALIAQWHRERDGSLLQNYEQRMDRVEALEGRVTALVRANDRRIAELRRRRRLASGDERSVAALTAVIDELERESEHLVAELSQTRAQIRRTFEEQEERLWRRTDLLVEVETMHLVRWEASKPHSNLHWVTRLMTSYVPNGPSRGHEKDEIMLGADPRWRETLRQLSQPPPNEDQKSAAPAGLAGSKPQLIDVHPAGVNGVWTPQRIVLLRRFWSEGVPASEIAKRLGISVGRVVGKAYRIGLPKRTLASDSELPTQGPRNEDTSAAESHEEAKWTPEREALLRKLWAKGLSAKMIANLIGNCSRKAVIGKAGRLGLPVTQAPIRPLATATIPSPELRRAIGDLWLQSTKLLTKARRSVAHPERLLEQHQKLSRDAEAVLKELELSEAQPTPSFRDAQQNLKLTAALFAERAAAPSSEQ